MSRITNALWRSEFPAILMPENLEYFDFIIIVKRKEQQQKRGEPLVFLRALSNLEKHAADQSTLETIRELIEWEVTHA